MGALADVIRTATGISAPRKGRQSNSHSLSWDTPDDVRVLSAWLRLTRPSIAEEARGAP